MWASAEAELYYNKKSFFWQTENQNVEDGSTLNFIQNKWEILQKFQIFFFLPKLAIFE
jgi:hypothetical protein